MKGNGGHAEFFPAQTIWVRKTPDFDEIRAA